MSPTFEEPALALLEALRVRLSRSRQTRLAAFESLVRQLERLSSLPARERAKAAELLASLRLPLERLVSANDSSASHREQIEITTIVRRTERTIDAVAGDVIASSESALEVAYAEVDLAALARDAVNAFDAVTRTRHVELTAKTPPQLVIEADPFKLDVIVLSLLFIAAKHATERGWVRLFLSTDHDGDIVELRVTDNGPTVPPAHAAAIFARSGEIERGTLTWVGEVPIGLSAARDLIALHGGALRLETVATDGVTLLATLPTRAPRGMPVRPATDRSPELAVQVATRARGELDAESRLASRRVERRGRPLVLVVEDSRTVQRVLVDALEPDHATMSAFDGNEALAFLEEETPDLIILDILLPSVNGERLIREVRSNEKLIDVPILVLTGSPDSEKLVRLLAGEVQDVVKKPFLAVEVLARVHNLLAEKRTRDVLNATIGRHETDLLSLAEQVAAQQEQLTQARHAAELANQVKSNFLRMMSHELRTPLTAMELQMKILERDPQAHPDERVQLGLDRLSRSTRRLRRIIDTVMAWARVEGGRCELEVAELSVPTLVDDVVKELRESATQKDVEIYADCQAGHSIHTDRSMATLVLLNLLGHAIQVTPAGAIFVTAVASGTGAQISVRDGGSRLPPGAEERIFRPLDSSESLHHQTGSGSGLDLHVVWDIARALDGNISLQRSPGPGNTYVLTLPDLPPTRTTATYARLDESR